MDQDTWPPFQTEREALIWLAAIFEGEGCFHINQSSGAVSAALQMTDKDVVEVVARLFDRVFRPIHRAPRKTIYHVQLCGQPAIDFMTAIYPFMGSRRSAKIRECLERYTGGPRKLTWEQVTEIRQALAQGKTQESLAEQYGVDQATVSSIKLRKFYKEEIKRWKLVL